MLIARNTVAAETVFIESILSSITGIVNYNTPYFSDYAIMRLVYIVFFEYVMPYKMRYRQL